MKKKHTLRKQLVLKKNLLPLYEKRRRASLIVQKIIRLEEYKCADIIISYLEIKRELSTTPLLLQAMKQNKKIFIPLPDMYPLFFRELYDLQEIQYYISNSGSTRNIPVPREPRTHTSPLMPTLSDLAKISPHILALVPGLGFSPDGSRLGRGGGFYDHLLAQPFIRHSIGICFQEQVLADGEIPLEIHDKAVNRIVHI